MTRKIYFIFLIWMSIINIYSQNTSVELIGEITYKTAQYSYVRFSKDINLSAGDTLFILQENNYIPTLIVKHISKTSAACEVIQDSEIVKGLKIYGKNRIVTLENQNKKDESLSKVVSISPTILNDEEINKSNRIDNLINGRFSISSYSILSNSKSNDYQRWRYRLSLKGDHLIDSSFSFDSYITFAYRSDQWYKTSKELNKAVKIYSLSGKFNFNDKYSLTFGRNINKKVTNLSVIDGLQFNADFAFSSIGLIIGSRPNIYDYGYNLKMFEYGFYLNRNDKFENSYMENTLAYLEQTNNYKTDRRFLYLQHTNNLLENLNLFLSSEIDIYKREKGISKGDFRFTSIYLSARFTPSRIISFTTSYDARKNIVYYETYQSFADSLMDIETRQGFKFKTTIRPLRFLSINASYGFRYRGENIRSTNNFNSTISYNQLPFVNLSVSTGYTFLSTNYLKSNIIDLRLSKYIFDGMININTSYRNIKYNFDYTKEYLIQHLFMVDTGLNLSKIINLSLSYEATFEKNRTYGRLFINLNSRF